MALSRVISKIFNVEKYRDLEILANQGHWKWYHSIDWVCFLLVFCINFVIMKYSTSKMPGPWKPGKGSVKIIYNVTIR